MEKFYNQSSGWGTDFCTTDELFDREMKFIVDGKFTIKVNGIFNYETDDDVSASTAEQQKWYGGIWGTQLWENDNNKDFAFISQEEKELKFHKTVLRTRSAGFAALLNSNMKEATENKVELPDFPFDVIATGLKLIYECEFTSTLYIDELILLLQFFEEFNLPDLKEKVEPYLINQISPVTVCCLTNWSIKTKSPKLKDKCMEFLSAAFASKTALSDFNILDKDVVCKIVENSLYQIVNTNVVQN